MIYDAVAPVKMGNVVEKRVDNEPQRCPACRKAKKMQSGGGYGGGGRCGGGGKKLVSTLGEQ